MHMKLTQKRQCSLPDKSVTAVNLKENATSAISCL